MKVLDIQKGVCKHYDVKMSVMLSESRKMEIVRPRQVAMYFSRRLTGKGFLEIALLFNRENHTTITTAFDKIAALRSEDSKFRLELLQIEEKLNEPPSRPKKSDSSFLKKYGREDAFTKCHQSDK